MPENVCDLSGRSRNDKSLSRGDCDSSSAHFVGTRAQNDESYPVMRTLSFGGFTEGWGIYAERLGDEMGLYVTTLDRAGYLVHLLDVAVAAYLDIGYHTGGWTRQHLVDSMVILGGRSPAMAAAYADRHAARPGQLATYYIGFEGIRSYREVAARALGTGFGRRSSTARC